MGWVFVLLGIAVCCAWLPDVSLRGIRVPAWLPAFVLAVLLGVWFRVVMWPGLFALLALIVAALLSRTTSRPARDFSAFVAIAIALVLSLHLAPGFNNPKLFDSTRLSDDAAPFTQYLNFDKGAAGLVLLWAYGARSRTLAELGRVLRIALPIAVVTTIAVIVLGLGLHYVRLDLKFPELGVAFLATNLLFTCVAEEAFFRGVLQERLARSLDGRPSLRWLPPVVSALLFGLAHASAGSMYLLLATVAGLGYSIAYAATRRVEAAVLAHFAVNATQFLGFTYPYLVRA
jgi:uncharacterized protein